MQMGDDNLRVYGFGSGCDTDCGVIVPCIHDGSRGHREVYQRG